ncbi:hypothetical protein ABTX71_02110 [Streptomyces parvulus]|uniref:hypothetical protein n=1 Tax=Streptomyces parvulus TaxID=146923 RepID=UPI00331C3BC7
MARPYNLSPEGRARLVANAAKARQSAHSLDTYITRIVDRAPELTDEQIARLRPLLARVSGGASE